MQKIDFLAVFRPLGPWKSNSSCNFLYFPPKIIEIRWLWSIFMKFFWKITDSDLLPPCTGKTAFWDAAMSCRNTLNMMESYGWRKIAAKTKRRSHFDYYEQTLRYFEYVWSFCKKVSTDSQQFWSSGKVGTIRNNSDHYSKDNKTIRGHASIVRSTVSFDKEYRMKSVYNHVRIIVCYCIAPSHVMISSCKRVLMKLFHYMITMYHYILSRISLVQMENH